MSGRIEDRLKEMQSLPVIEPPAELEAKTIFAMGEAAIELQQRQSSAQFAKAASWVAVVGIGALLTLWTVNDRPMVEPTTADPIANDEIFLRLAQESARLEEILVLLPAPRRVMRGDTASTIVGLEDWITLIDAELYSESPQAIAPEFRTALMQDRVEAMNALVNVRYAQSRAFNY